MRPYLVAITIFFIAGAPDRTPLVPYVLVSLALIGLSWPWSIKLRRISR